MKIIYETNHFSQWIYINIFKYVDMENVTWLELMDLNKEDRKYEVWGGGTASGGY